MPTAADRRSRLSLESASGSISGVDCVVLSCFADDVRFLATLLGLSRIRLHRADTLDEADFLITATGATVLVTDSRFLDGSWQHAAEMLRQRHPLLPAIVLAEVIESGSLSRAGDLGVFDICWKPPQFAILRAAVQRAHEATLDRIAEYEIQQAARLS